MPKKNFTKADGAIDKLFSRTQEENHGDVSVNITKDTNNTNNTNNTDNTKDTYITKDEYNSQHTNDTYITQDTNIKKYTKPTNKSKHYNQRGKREKRFGLLLDERLKNDLTDLSKATGSKSVNDLIITVLLEYVEKPHNQSKLEQYKKLLSL